MGLFGAMMSLPPIRASISAGSTGVQSSGAVVSAALSMPAASAVAGATLNQATTTGTSMSVPTSTASSSSTQGWLSYTNFIDHAKNSLGISTAAQKTQAAWDDFRTDQAPNKFMQYFYNIMNWTGSLLTVMVSASCNGGGDQWLLAIQPTGQSVWQVQGGNSAGVIMTQGTSGPSQDPPAASLSTIRVATAASTVASMMSAASVTASPPAASIGGAAMVVSSAIRDIVGPLTISGMPEIPSIQASMPDFSDQLADLRASLEEARSADLQAARDAQFQAASAAMAGSALGIFDLSEMIDAAIPEPESIPTATISVAEYAENFGTTIPDLIADSDNVRFDINSSNVFGTALLSQREEAGIITDSNSPLEALGIATNKIKILLVSDYDLGLEDADESLGILDPSHLVLNESFGYSRVRHNHIYDFFETDLFKEVELLIELEETYQTKEAKLQKSIEYIRSIDEFKAKFISELSNYNSSLLQYIGFMPSLNPTRAIRQAFFSAGLTAVNGGVYLSHRLNEVYETPSGLDMAVAPESDSWFNVTKYDGHANPTEKTSLFMSQIEFSPQQSASTWPNSMVGGGPSGIMKRAFGHSATPGIKADKDPTSPEYHLGIPSSQLTRSVYNDMPDSPPSVALELAEAMEGSKTGASIMWKYSLDRLRKDYFGGSKAALAAHIAHGQFVELLRAYIISTNEYDLTDGNGEQYIVWPAKNTVPLISDILGDAGVGNQKFKDIDNTKKLGKLLKWPGTENTVYPFEKPSAKFEAGDKKLAVSGISKWFDENIGNIFEERPTDFRGLDEFAADFQSTVSAVENRLKPFAIDGHGQLFFNEAARVIRDIFSGEINEAGAHPQQFLTQVRSKGGFDFSEYVQDEIATGTFQPPIDPEELEELLDRMEDIERSGAEWADMQKEMDRLNNLITEDAVREGLAEVEQELERLERMQDMYMSYDALVAHGVIMEAGIPMDEEEFITGFSPIETDSMVETITGATADYIGEGLATGMMHNAVDELVNAQSHTVTSTNMASTMDSSTVVGDTITQDITSGVGAGAQAATAATMNVTQGSVGAAIQQAQAAAPAAAAAPIVMPLMTMMSPMFLNGSDGTLVALDRKVEDIDNTQDLVTNHVFSNQGLLEGESLSLAENKIFFIRKIAFLIEILSKIDTLNPHQFWYLCYNSTQGNVYSKEYQKSGSNFNKELLKDLVGPGRISSPGDSFHKEHNKQNGKIEHHPPFVWQALMAHILEMLHAVCANIEKNMFFNIAAIADEYGLSPRSAPADEESDLLALADTIFGEGARYIYSGAGAPKIIAPMSVNRKNNVGESHRYTHLELRASVLMMLCHMSKNIKTDLGASSNMRLIELMIRPNPTSNLGEVQQSTKFSRGYITVNPNVNLLAIEAMAAKLILPIVDNVDPAKGPVKWKLTYGDWASSGFKLGGEDFVNRFVIPEAIIPLVDEGLSAVDPEDWAAQNSLTRPYGLTPQGQSVINDANPGNHIPQFENLVRLARHHFSFTLKIGDIVPYTFVDNSEIPKTAYAIAPPRGGLKSIIKSCVYLREDNRRLLEWLNKISKHYLEAKDSMLALKDDPNGAELFEHAKLPGIEVQEIIKYSSLRQTFLRSFIASEESGLSSYSYLPSSNFIHPSSTDSKFIDVLNRFLRVNAHLDVSADFEHFDVKQAIASSGNASNRDNRHINAQKLLEEGKIVVLGVPDGMIDTGLSQKPRDILERLVKVSETCNHYFPSTNVGGSSVNPIRPTYRDFWPGLFINRANIFSLLSNDAVNSPLDFLKNLQYGTIDPDTGRYKIVGYNDLISSSGNGAGILEKIINKKQGSFQDPSTHFDSSEGYEYNTGTYYRAKNLLFNHVLSDLLKIYLDFYAGLNTAETSYSVNLQSNVLYVDPITLDNIDMLINHPNIAIESADMILDDNIIVPFKVYFERQSADSNPDVAYDRYSNFVAYTQMRLFSADQMATMTLVPNIFDRTFAVYSHFGQKRKTDGTLFDFPEYDDSSSLGKVGNDFNAMMVYKAYPE